MGDDRSPAWSAGSDTIYYSGSSSELVPSEGVLLAIHRSGGPARLLLSGQGGLASPPRLVEPSAARPSEALAFVELRNLRPEQACAADTIVCDSRRLASARLEEAWLRVAESARAPSWPTVSLLRFSGAARFSTEMFDGVALFETRYTPHQLNWLVQRTLPLKPSWSPDGRQLLTADDEGIHVVDAATGTRTLIATGDVANPAWAPSGERIAFDRVERLDSITEMCLLLATDPKNSGGYVAQCWERRMFYRTTDPVIALARPDGSDAIEIGPGADPEWDPTGRWLYFVGPAAIFRRDMERGTVDEVPGTALGGEPAVSPDGRWLAFTRYDDAHGGRDVWVASLAAE